MVFEKQKYYGPSDFRRSTAEISSQNLIGGRKGKGGDAIECGPFDLRDQQLGLNQQVDVGGLWAERD